MEAFERNSFVCGGYKSAQIVGAVEAYLCRSPPVAVDSTEAEGGGDRTDSCRKSVGRADVCQFEVVASVGFSQFMNIAAEDVSRTVDERYFVAKLFDASHVVGREDDCGSFVAQFQYLAFEYVGFDGVESGESLVENQ